MRISFIFSNLVTLNPHLFPRQPNSKPKRNQRPHPSTHQLMISNAFPSTRRLDPYTIPVILPRTYYVLHKAQPCESLNSGHDEPRIPRAPTCAHRVRTHHAHTYLYSAAERPSRRRSDFVFPKQHRV